MPKSIIVLIQYNIVIYHDGGDSKHLVVRRLSDDLLGTAVVPELR